MRNPGWFYQSKPVSTLSLLRKSMDAMLWDQQKILPVEANNFSEILGSSWNLNNLQGSKTEAFPLSAKWGDEQLHYPLGFWYISPWGIVALPERWFEFSLEGHIKSAVKSGMLSNPRSADPPPVWTQPVWACLVAWYSLQGHMFSNVCTLARPEPKEFNKYYSIWMMLYKSLRRYRLTLYPVNPLPICVFQLNNFFWVSLFLDSLGGSSIPGSCSCSQKRGPIAGCRKYGVCWHELFLVLLSHG